VKKRNRALLAGTVFAAAGALPAVAIAGQDLDVSVSGPDVERAAAAALAHSGGGRVTATEAEDEASYYEVEVTLEDGSQIDVQLDEEFVIVHSETDGPDSDESSDRD
jgi:hypothetical protein